MGPLNISIRPFTRAKHCVAARLGGVLLVVYASRSQRKRAVKWRAGRHGRLWSTKQGGLMS